MRYSLDFKPTQSLKIVTRNNLNYQISNQNKLNVDLMTIYNFQLGSISL
jgi:hypothetical protein